MATTISTHSIEDVTFPKIYVCPPKHTYTNLNQDIVDLHNVSLNDDQVKELLSLIEKKTEEIEHKNTMEGVQSFVEKNKFYNWYMGISKASLPYIFETYQYHFQTWSTQGSIKSPYFGEPYNEQKFHSGTFQNYELKVKS